MDANRWYFTKESLDRTPSRRDGVDVLKEVFYRQQAATLIQDMGQKLLVSQLCINSAIVYMHRFYMFHSFTKFHRNFMAPCCLFLACKVEEQPRKLEQLLRVGWSFINREAAPLDVKSGHFRLLYDELVRNENILLATLGFDCSIDHPHTHVVRCCQLIKASRDLAQTSYFMATNSLHLTTMCLQYRSTLVACVCIYLVYKWSGHEIPRSSEGREWFWYVDREVTMEQLERVSEEFLLIFNQCPSKLKKKIMSSSKAISDQEAERRHRSEGQRSRAVPSSLVSSSVTAASSDVPLGQPAARHSASSAAVSASSTSSSAARASRERKEHVLHGRERRQEHREVRPSGQEHREVRPPGQEHRDGRVPGQEHREPRVPGQEHREARGSGQEHREARGSGQEHREPRVPGQEHREVRVPGHELRELRAPVQDVRGGRMLGHEHRDARSSGQEHRDTRSGSGHDHRDARLGHEYRDVRGSAREHRDSKSTQDHRATRTSGQDHRDMRVSSHEHRENRSLGQDLSEGRVPSGSMPSLSRSSSSLSASSSSVIVGSAAAAVPAVARSSSSLSSRGRSVGDVRQLLQGVDCRHSLLTTPADKSRRSQPPVPSAAAASSGLKSGSSGSVPRSATSDSAVGSGRSSVNGPQISPSRRQPAQSACAHLVQPTAAPSMPGVHDSGLQPSSSLLRHSVLPRGREAVPGRAAPTQAPAGSFARGPDLTEPAPRLTSPPILQPFTMSPPLILPGICDNMASDDLGASSVDPQLAPLADLAEPAALVRGRSSIFSPPAVVQPAAAPDVTALSSVPAGNTFSSTPASASFSVRPGGEVLVSSITSAVANSSVKVEAGSDLVQTKTVEVFPEPVIAPVPHVPSSLSSQPSTLAPIVADAEDKHKHREKKKKHKEHKEHKAKKEKKKHKDKEHKKSKHRDTDENLSKLRITISRDRLGSSGVVPVDADDRRHDSDGSSTGLKIRIGKDKLLSLTAASAESPVKKRGRDSDAAADTAGSGEHHRHHHAKHKSKHKRRRQDSEMSDSLQF